MKHTLISQLVLLSCVGSLALAQGNENASPPVFVERIDVNIVNVEVFVTDSQGRHVFGLTKDDFEITEDGRPVEITNFFTVEREDRLTRILEGDETDRRDLVVPFGAGAYALRYRIDHDAVVVIRVWHSR